MINREQEMEEARRKLPNRWLKPERDRAKDGQCHSRAGSSFEIFYIFMSVILRRLPSSSQTELNANDWAGHNYKPMAMD